MLVDTHAHLDDPLFASDVADVVSRAQVMGVGKIVTIGTDTGSILRASEIAQSFENVYFGAGIHPHMADSVRIPDAKFEEALSHPKNVAIGETGLDYYKKYAERGNQKKLFLYHIGLALKYKKAIVIHCREAHKECRDILRSQMPKPVRGVIHCFSGNKEDLTDYVDMGFYISIAGPITYPNAKGLREVVKFLPKDRAVVETDCPYLAPQPQRGKRNEPAFVKYTAQTLVDTLGISFDEFAEQSTKNAEELFGIK